MEPEYSLPCSQKLTTHPCVELDVSSTLRCLVRCITTIHVGSGFSWLCVFCRPRKKKNLPPPLFSSQFILSTFVCGVQQFVRTDQNLEKQNEEDLRPVK